MLTVACLVWQVPPSEYAPYVRAYLAAHPNASIFVATDSPSFLDEVTHACMLAHTQQTHRAPDDVVVLLCVGRMQQVRATWPSRRLVYRADVLRHEANVAFGGGGGGGKSGAAYRKGEEVCVWAACIHSSSARLHLVRVAGAPRRTAALSLRLPAARCLGRR